MIPKNHLEATPASGAALFSRKISGKVVMLNLLRFRDMADYADHPELAPSEAITGRAAYQKYIEHTLPLLKQSGGTLQFLGEGGKYLIGPQDEHWDVIMLVHQNSLDDFMAFASNQKYLLGIGHRTAALEDSRLLPMVAYEENNITSYQRPNTMT